MKLLHRGTKTVDGRLVRMDAVLKTTRYDQAWCLVQGYTLFRAEDKRGKREARPTASFIIAGAH